MITWPNLATAVWPKRTFGPLALTVGQDDTSSETIAVNGLTQRLSDHTQRIEFVRLHTADATTLEHVWTTAKRLQHQTGHYTNKDIQSLIRTAKRRLAPGRLGDCYADL